jgi:hypothetical protein
VTRARQSAEYVRQVLAPSADVSQLFRLMRDTPANGEMRVTEQGTD